MGAQAVLLHSPKAARQLAKLLRGRRASDLSPLCLSRAVGRPLARAQLGPRLYAPMPMESALLNLIGLGLAPPSIALLGESIAGKNAGLGTAIAIVIPLACGVALLAFATSMGAYRQARADLKQ